MTDSVASKVIVNDGWHYVAAFVNHSDGTGESDVVKIDKSTLTYAKTGAAPESLQIEEIQWSTDGMFVTLEWDRGTDQTIMVLAGTGCYKACDHGALSETGATGATTGDVLLTTTGHGSGDTYWILIKAKFR